MLCVPGRPKRELVVPAQREQAGEPAGNLFANKIIEWLDESRNGEHCVVASHSFGDAACVSAHVPPARLSQDRGRGDERHFHLLQVVTGQWRCESDVAEYVQVPGDVVVMGQRVAFQAAHDTSVRFVRWDLPSAILRPLMPEVDPARAMYHLSRTRGMTRMLAGSMRLMSQNAGQLDDSQQQRLLLQLCALTGQAVEAETGLRGNPRDAYRVTQMQRILAYIEAHSGDPELSARVAARDLNISVRWLHALLEDGGESFAEAVARRRLERAYRLLTNPATRHAPIIDIAYHVGFNDLSTFYRRFRIRYGTTPRAVRGTGPEA